MTDPKKTETMEINTATCLEAFPTLIELPNNSLLVFFNKQFLLNQLVA